MRIKKKKYLNLCTSIFSKQALLKYKLSLKKKWKHLKFQNPKFYINTTKRQILCKSIKKLYTERLKCKKLIKQLYGNITENTFKRIYYKVYKNPINLIKYCEMQLNTILFRVTDLPTLYASNSCINSKLVILNNKITSKPNIALKPGDRIQLKSQTVKVLKKTLKYVEISERLNTFIILANPSTQKIPCVIKLPIYLGFEFYKK